MADGLNPREREMAQRLRKKYGSSVNVARMLAWVAAHASELKHVEGLPRALYSLPDDLRRGRGLGHDSLGLMETAENLLHALSFKRNYDAPHFVYQNKVKNMLAHWTEALDSELQDLVLDRTGGLERPDASALQDLAEAYWERNLIAAAQRAVNWMEGDQYTRKKREEQELADLLALEEEKAHPTAGTW